MNKFSFYLNIWHCEGQLQSNKSYVIMGRIFLFGLLFVLGFFVSFCCGVFVFLVFGVFFWGVFLISIAGVNSKTNLHQCGNVIGSLPCADSCNGYAGNI